MQKKSYTTAAFTIGNIEANSNCYCAQHSRHHHGSGHDCHLSAQLQLWREVHGGEYGAREPRHGLACVSPEFMIMELRSSYDKTYHALGHNSTQMSTFLPKTELELGGFKGTTLNY